MKKYIVPLIIICSVLFILMFVVNRKGMTDTKFYLEENLYNQKNTEIPIKKSNLTKLQKEKENFVVFFSMPYCTFDIPCENIFKDVFNKADVSFYSMSFSDIKGTKLNDEIKYAPTIALFKNGELVVFLDPNSEDDLDKYESKKEFKKWLSNYIYLES